jgi:hypothetical protein
MDVVLLKSPTLTRYARSALHVHIRRRVRFEVYWPWTLQMTIAVRDYDREVGL